VLIHGSWPLPVGHCQWGGALVFSQNRPFSYSESNPALTSSLIELQLWCGAEISTIARAVTEATATAASFQVVLFARPC